MTHFLRNISWRFYIWFLSFCLKSSERKQPKKHLFIFRYAGDVCRGHLKRGLTSNKPTYNLPDYGDVLQSPIITPKTTSSGFLNFCRLFRWPPTILLQICCCALHSMTESVTKLWIISLQVFKKPTMLRVIKVKEASIHTVLSRFPLAFWQQQNP